MSVIFSLFHKDSKPIDLSTLEKISNESNFFEADRVDHWFQGRVGLGHLQLYNSHESLQEKLPFTHPVYPATITADVRLDNRNLLIQDLQISNSNITDSELILESYLKYGEDCVSFLLGAFAFIIWDAKKDKLFSARDHIGVRPFYYYFHRNVFAASSLIKGLKVIPNIDLSLNDNMIKNILITTPLEKDETWYKHIKVLKPAHTISVQSGHLKLRKYWELDATKKVRFEKDDEYVEAFQEKMFEAVRCRLRTNKNIGVELSGGLDSSGISVVAQEILSQSGRDLYTYSYTMPEEDLGKVYPFEDEDKYIDEVCHLAGIKNNTKITRSNYKDYRDRLDLSNWLYDGINFNDGLGLDPIKEIAQNDNVNVLLSGFPGDNLITSNAHQYYLEFLEERKMWSFLIDLLLEKKNTSRKGFYAILWLLSGINQQWAQQLYQHFSKPQKDIVKSRKAKNFLSDAYAEKHPHLGVENNITYEQPTLHLNFKESQKANIARKPFHLRMAGENIAGLYRRTETRYPLADIRLLQYVLSVPASQKRNKTHGRLLYRKALSDRLPDSVAWKNPKMGATIPFSYGELKRNRNSIMPWLHSLKKNKNLRLINLDKLIQQAEIFYDKGSRTNSTGIYGRKQHKLHLLARYMETQPNLYSEIIDSIS